MMLRGLGLVFCALSAMSAPTAATEYVIDTKGGHASINFRVQHLGFSWLTGRFDTFSGAFRYDEKNPSASGISVTIDTTSVNSNHAERDKHLRGADFLDVAAFLRRRSSASRSQRTATAKLSSRAISHCAGSRNLLPSPPHTSEVVRIHGAALGTVLLAKLSLPCLISASSGN